MLWKCTGIEKVREAQSIEDSRDWPILHARRVVYPVQPPPNRRHPSHLPESSRRCAKSHHGGLDVFLLTFLSNCHLSRILFVLLLLDYFVDILVAAQSLATSRPRLGSLACHGSPRGPTGASSAADTTTLNFTSRLHLAPSAPTRQSLQPGRKRRTQHIEYAEARRHRTHTTSRGTLLPQQYSPLPAHPLYTLHARSARDIMARSSTTVSYARRQEQYVWPEFILNVWVIIMLATGGLLIGVFATFINM